MDSIMKKFIIITTLTLTTLLSSVTAFANTSVKEALPNKPPLSTKYATSFDEMSAEIKKTLEDSSFYEQDGKHLITIFNGPYLKYTFCSSDVVTRADFKIDNVETDWIGKLSSDNTLDVRIITIKTTYSSIEFPEDPPSYHSRSYVCIYGDKAEKWFAFYGSDLRPPKKQPGVYWTSEPTFSTAEKGGSSYYPIFTLNDTFADSYDMGDFGELNFRIYYSDPDWLVVDHFDIVLDGLNHTVTWDDITCTSNFKTFFVDYGSSRDDNELYVKYKQLYGSLEENDPFSDKKNSSKDKNKDKDKKTSDNEPTWRIPLPTEEPDKKDNATTSGEKTTETPTPTEKTSETPSETPALTEKPSEPTIPSAEPTVPPVDADETQTAVYLNGQLLEFSESPVTFNDRVLVPMRKIFEALDADVDWNQDNMSVSAQKDGTLINMQIGSTLFQKDDSKITLDTAPILVNDTTMVPIRAIAEAFGANIVWNSVDKSVVIETK